MFIVCQGGLLLRGKEMLRKYHLIAGSKDSQEEVLYLENFSGFLEAMRKGDSLVADKTNKIYWYYIVNSALGGNRVIASRNYRNFKK